MIRKDRKTWWALLLVAALLVGLLPTAVLAESGSAGSGVDYTVSSDADAPEQEPVEEEQEEPEEPEEEEPVEEPEEELIEDVALQMIAPLSMPRAATEPNEPTGGRTYDDKEAELLCSGSFGEEDINNIFPLTLGEGVRVRLKDFTLDYSTKYPGYSPISVAKGATATIIIDGNVTLKGGDASGTTGAAPAIHVPEGSTLYIESTGERDENNNPVDSLTVYGGNAAKGGDGTMSEYAAFTGTSISGSTWYGGQGGAGGGGAAPAIGGMGGNGGAAPDRQAPMYNGNPVAFSLETSESGEEYIEIYFAGNVNTDIERDGSGKLINPSQWSFNPIPTAIPSGCGGEQGGGAGNIYITGSLVLSGSGGSAAGGGKGASGGDGVSTGNAANPGVVANGVVAPTGASKVCFASKNSNYTSTSTEVCDCIVGFSGGGGGGGGGGCGAPFIGTGGAGGSSGGSGAPPVVNFFAGLANRFSVFYVSDDEDAVTVTSTPGGAGGGGGWPNGGGGGGGGATSKLINSGQHYLYQPGKGGEAGADGKTGEEGIDSYKRLFGDKAYLGGEGGKGGNNTYIGNEETRDGAKGGSKITSTYTVEKALSGGKDFVKSYTFPAGGSGGGAVSAREYVGSNVVLSTGVKVKTNSAPTSGTGFRGTYIIGGGEGHCGNVIGSTNPQNTYKKIPIGIYDLADCTVAVLSRVTTPADGANAVQQLYTGHNYAPEFYEKTDTSGPGIMMLGEESAEPEKREGLQITVSYSAAANSTALLHQVAIGIDYGSSLYFPKPGTEETELADGTKVNYSYFKEFGITEEPVDGHGVLINVGDTYQIAGLSSAEAVKKVTGVTISSAPAVAVGTWTDKLQITQVTPTGVKVTAKEGSTNLETNAFLTAAIKTGTTPKVTLNYKWSDGTNPYDYDYDDLWLLLSKTGTIGTDVNTLLETWTVSKDGDEADEIVSYRYAKNTDEKVEVQKHIYGTVSVGGAPSWYWENINTDAPGGAVKPGTGETGTETTTTEFQKVSTSSASYSFDEPGEYTFTLTLSGMGYAQKTASFTVKVKQHLKATFWDGCWTGTDSRLGTEETKLAHFYREITACLEVNSAPADPTENAIDGVTVEYVWFFPYHNEGTGNYKRVVGAGFIPTDATMEENEYVTLAVGISELSGTRAEYYTYDTVPTISSDNINESDLSKFNTLKIVDHSYTDGFCTIGGSSDTTCGEYQPAETGNGGFYQIANAGQLYWYAALWNNDNTHAHWGSDVSPAGAELTANINLASTHNPNEVTGSAGNIVGYEWIPIACAATVSESSGKYSATGAFTGSFNGAGHTISGLYISQQHDKHNGFIAVAGEGSQVVNLTLKGDMIVQSNKNGSSNDTGIGSVVGWGANFKLEDVTSKVNINGSELYHVGGLVGCTRGNNKSTITRCIYAGTIDLTSSTDSIGGIAGCAHGVNILYSANRGRISTTTGTSSNGGTHTDLVGGIAGQLQSGSIKNCYSSEIPTQDGVNKGGLIGILRTSTTVENSVYPSSTSAIVSDESGGANSSPQSHTGLTDISAFNTGKACYLANGSTDTGAWRQNLDNAASNNGANPDAYPRLVREFTDSEPASDAIVYQMPDKATYSNSLPVYSVDVSWGSMLFTYQQGEWQPDKHDYKGDWKQKTNTDVNQVKVDNKSQWKVNASVQFQAESAFADKVAGTITFGDENWSGQVLEANKSGTATLQLSRKPDTTSLLEDDFAEETSTKVGTVTVTITPGSYN